MNGFRRPSHATVVAYLALFVALGAGGAYAADTIGSDDVIDESLRSRDIKDGEVKSTEIGANAVNSARVADDKLLGVDINEASLEGLVRSFGARVDEQTPSNLMFSVPELKVSILNKASAASGSGFRVRNDSTTTGENVFVGNFVSREGAVFTVPPASTSTDHGGDSGGGPWMVTSQANRNLMLVFDCSLGPANQNYCFGQLMRAPLAPASG